MKQKLLSYEAALPVIHLLKIKSKSEWMSWIKNNRDNGFPVEPRTVYLGKGWVSWGEWLGTGVIGDKNQRKLIWPYEQAKEFVRGLCLANEAEFHDWASKDSKPEFIPLKPRRVYQDMGTWVSMGDFLGTDNLHAKPFLSYEEARTYVVNLKLCSVLEWQAWAKSGLRPENIPSHPDQSYRNIGWQDFSTFLGYRRKSSYGEKIIAQFLAQNGVQYTPQWRHADCKHSKPLPFDFMILRDGEPLACLEYHGIQHYKPIPFMGGDKALEYVQKMDGIKERFCEDRGILFQAISYEDIDKLGSRLRGFFNCLYPGKKFKPLDRSSIDASLDWMPYDESRVLILAANIPNALSYRQWHTANRPFGIPYNPEIFYKHHGWSNWADFLGTKNLDCKLKKSIFVSYEECRAWMITAGVRNGQHWDSVRRTKPDNIPSHPEIIYREEGWIGWREFLSPQVELGS